MVSVGKDFKDHLVPAPLAMSRDQDAQSSIQPGLEHFQGGSICSFSGQPGPGPHHPHSTVFLPYI